ncbi:hypothetical protein PG994_001595 [Apiospora phragmitis]|uniref:Uncharacterized protein n=1 Tax=Apiospora phragmitis TaxID=2905665 RepID=A0ABR1WTZ7_9PEZI
MPFSIPESIHKVIRLVFSLVRNLAEAANPVPQQLDEHKCEVRRLSCPPVYWHPTSTFCQSVGIPAVYPRDSVIGNGKRFTSL